MPHNNSAPGSDAAPRVTVNGETVQLVLEGLDALPDEQAREARAIFEAKGFAEVDGDAWHSQETWLAALREIATTVEGRALRSLGRQIPKTTVWPDGVETVPDAIASINDAYRLNHRGPELGAYAFDRTDDHKGRVTTTTPYPCLFDIGIVEGVIREFSPTVTTTALTFVHEVSDTCREDGGDKCTYAVRW